MATENAKRMAVLPEEDTLNVQLIQELRQQRQGVHGGALAQQQLPVDQEIDEMVGQLKSLKLSKAELAEVAATMSFLDRIREDSNQYT